MGIPDSEIVTRDGLTCSTFTGASDLLTGFVDATGRCLTQEDFDTRPELIQHPLSITKRTLSFADGRCVAMGPEKVMT